MREICIREKMQVTCIEKSAISEQNLYENFIVNNGQTIYVTQYDKVVGMITVGNFIRNCLNNTELITRKFTMVRPENEADAIRILEENIWMDSVPVINNDDQIEKEYYVHKESFQHDRINEIIKTIRQIILEMKFWGKSEQHNKIILYYDLLNDEQINELNYQSNEKLLVTNKLSIEDIEHYAYEGYFLICDFCPDTYRVRNIYYSKYGMKSIKWDLNWIEIGECLTDRANYFRKNGIAVFADSENYLYECLKEIDYQLLDEDQLVWDEQFKCLLYKGSIDDSIECVLTMTCFLEHPYILFRTSKGNKHIPVLSRIYVDQQIAIEASEYDILTNIFPAFQGSSVKFLLLNDPDVESKMGSNLANRVADGLKWKNQKRVFYREKTEEEFQQILKETTAFVPSIRDGYFQRVDIQGKYVNCINGERYTVENSGTGPRIFHVLGPCTLIGTAVEDQCTIPSYLRPSIPQAYYIKNHTPGYENINFAIRAQEYHEHDIIMFMVRNIDLFAKAGVQTHSIIQAYKNMPDVCDHVLDELKHVNEVALKYIAREIEDLCIRENLFKDKVSGVNKKISFGTGKKNLPKELKEWLAESVKKYKSNNAERAGAVVMNCNPFTQGHRYLIEQASSQVDILYVFVLEEDKSYFNFNNRFDMVKAGTKDIENVIVLPSGKFVISTQTMPGYFNKENQPFLEADAALDLSYFAEAIAKEFEIKVRFAGEEPKDKFTKKYNEAMSRLLPEYGIEFCEIPRKQVGDTVISASLVRKYLEERNYGAIKELVLPDIYEYLKQHFFIYE